MSPRSGQMLVVNDYVTTTSHTPGAQRFAEHVATSSWPRTPETGAQDDNLARSLSETKRPARRPAPACAQDR